MTLTANNKNNNSTETLVHLQISSTNACLQIKEQPLVSELELDTDPDNLALLFAVAEVMEIDNPLTVTEVALFEQLALLQINSCHWLALPNTDNSALALATLLNDSKISNQDAVKLSATQAQQLMAQSDSALTLDTDIEIRLALPDATYDLLMRRNNARKLKLWLAQLDSYAHAS